MGKEQWGIVRKKVIKFNTRKTSLKKEVLCHACGDPISECPYKKPLECHEVYEYDIKTLTASVVGVVGICFSCHSFLHGGRLEALKRDGKISTKKYNEITRKGKQNLSRVSKKVYSLFLREEEAVLAEMNSAWVLQFNGVTYKGRKASKPNSIRKSRKPPNTRTKRIRTRRRK